MIVLKVVIDVVIEVIVEHLAAPYQQLVVVELVEEEKIRCCQQV